MVEWEKYVWETDFYVHKHLGLKRQNPGISVLSDKKRD
jgi:hypothetical protein